MSLCIIEYSTREQPLSTGVHVRIHPVVRIINFAHNANTGMRHVTEIREFDLFDDYQRPRAEYIALFGIEYDLHNATQIEFHDATGFGLFDTYKPTSDHLQTARHVANMLNLCACHALGYRDNDGSLSRDLGDDLFKAYATKPGGDNEAYTRVAMR